MRYLHFESVRGDLQEGNVYDKRLCGYASRCQSQSPRAQNRDFCALLPSGTPIFGHFEHKIGVFVRFWGLEALFSGISSTKSRFLCAFGVWKPCFRAFRAQNRHFCALLGSGSPVFGLFEHKIGVFVLFWPSGPSFFGVSLLLEEHFRVMEQFDYTFVVAHVLRIYDIAYCLKLHCGVWGH